MTPTVKRNLKIALTLLTLTSGIVAVAIAILFPVRDTPNVLLTSRLQSSPSGDGKEYAVTLSPAGTVTFRQPPQRVVTLDANYNDMLVSIGCGERLIATGYAQNVFDGFYAQLTGVGPGIDYTKLTFLTSAGGNAYDKELLYRLHADIHHIDPLQLAANRSWSKEDVAEIARNVGPFFANRYSRENSYAGKEPYEYYTLWELSDRIAQVYRRQAEIAALQAVCEKMIRQISSRLPPVEQRPRVGLIFYGKNRITTYSLLHSGFGQAQYAAVGACDAFEGKNIASYRDGGVLGTSLDLEGLLSINPDILIVPFAIYGVPGSAQGARAALQQLLNLKSDPLAQRLKAFQSGQIYPGGTPLQGPLFYLFQVEMAAKQIYPALFGAYRDDQRYPQNEWLFDRNKVAAILRKEVVSDASR